MSEKQAIWTPDGLVTLGGKKAERVELRSGVMEWLRQFSDVAAALHLGVHCAKCGADVIGKNADTDKVFSATCGCTEWVGQNRDYREPKPEVRH
jgi:hypothetical protein